MCKLTKHNATAHTVLPMEPIMDSTLSLAAKGMFAKLVANNGVIFNCDEAANAALSELIAHGYIEDITDEVKGEDM